MKSIVFAPIFIFFIALSAMKTDDSIKDITTTKNNIATAPWQPILEDTALAELGH